MFLLNTLKDVDWLFFFLIVPVVVILSVGAYLLPMLLRKKENQQAREELAAREAAYRLSKTENASHVEETQVEAKEEAQETQEIDDESL